MSDMSIDRTKLRGRIEALRGRTTDRGCTEAEAMAAAEKVSELLHRAGVTDLAELEFDQVAIEIGRRSVIDPLWSSVATFCHCEIWWAKGTKLKLVYFGRWNDAMVAEYLHQVLVRHVAEATKAFRATPEYKRRRTARTRRETQKAFQEGLARGLAEKLWSLQWRRFPRSGTPAEHKALVLAPLAAVKAEIERRGIAFSGPMKPIKGAGRDFDHHKTTGTAAARDININAPVAAAAPPIAGLIGR